MLVELLQKMSATGTSLICLAAVNQVLPPCNAMSRKQMHSSEGDREIRVQLGNGHNAMQMIKALGYQKICYC
jgi:hypothetical protein